MYMRCAWSSKKWWEKMKKTLQDYQKNVIFKCVTRAWTSIYLTHNTRTASNTFPNAYYISRNANLHKLFTTKLAQWKVANGRDPMFRFTQLRLCHVINFQALIDTMNWWKNETWKTKMHIKKSTKYICTKWVHFTQAYNVRLTSIICSADRMLCSR